MGLMIGWSACLTTGVMAVAITDDAVPTWLRWVIAINIAVTLALVWTVAT